MKNGRTGPLSCAYSKLLVNHEEGYGKVGYSESRPSRDIDDSLATKNGRCSNE